jgi:hypothetical protein
VNFACPLLTPPKENKRTKPIPEIQIGLNRRQKEIIKDFVGKSPKPPVDLNTVRVGKSMEIIDS